MLHTIIKMAFIKEESEDMKIEETFRVKQEDTEEQTDLIVLKVESEELLISSLLVHLPAILCHHIKIRTVIIQPRGGFLDMDRWVLVPLWQSGGIVHHRPAPPHCPEMAPVPVQSPVMAPVPVQSPVMAPVPVQSPVKAPAPDQSLVKAPASDQSLVKEPRDGSSPCPESSDGSSPCPESSDGSSPCPESSEGSSP
ncbi:unnamed protein product [Leuciscus chuanchicus]